MKKKFNKKGYLNSRIVKAITFYIIVACIFLSIFACIMAIWEVADSDVLLRLVGTFAVIGLGTWIFSIVNGLYGKNEIDE